MNFQTYSQFGQDQWVFDFLDQKTDGYFVDIGAWDGTILSNTRALQEQGWTGICCDPCLQNFDRVAINRGCITDKSVILDGRMCFFAMAPDGHSGIPHFLGSRREQILRNASGMLGKVVVTTSLKELLIRHKAPTIIDYLSLDTEGSEFEILKVFPFDQFQFRVISVEHNFEDKKRLEIFQLLYKNGYRQESGRGVDDIYTLKI